MTRVIAAGRYEDFTIELLAARDGATRFRLCLETADPDKIPRFRQALDCCEAILRLPDPNRPPPMEDAFPDEGVAA